jgi:hypothetical protein
MVTAYQVYGQPLFDMFESHIKAWRLRRSGAAPTGAITDAEKAAGRLGAGRMTARLLSTQAA